VQEKQMKMLNIVQKDGIVDIDIQGSPCAVQDVFGLESREEGEEQELGEDEDYDLQSIQPLKIVMLIIVTQGDVQPFIGIGRKLQVLKIFSPSTTTCVFVGVCVMHISFTLGIDRYMSRTRILMVRIMFPGVEGDIPECVQHSTCHW
jgi:hypothetical protein